MASTSTSCSIRSSSASLTSAVHMTPEEMIVRNEDVSYGRPAAAASSSARRMGLEKASPTMAMAFARWRWTASSSSSASSDRRSSVITVPPARWGMKVPSQTPVPCISGQAGIEIRRSPLAAASVTSGAICDGVRRRGQLEEREAGLHEARRQPTHRVHDALGHARGAAGVEHVDVVLAAGDALHRRVRGERVLPRHGAVDGGAVLRQAVVDRHQQPEPGKAGPHARHPVAERRVEHERLGVRVVQEVRELVVQVAVVDVDRHRPRLEPAELRLQVLVGVVEVEADLAVRPQAGRRQRAGEAGGPLVVLPPRPARRAVDDGGDLGLGVGERLPDGGEVHLHRRA